jgi:hypothetical protein
MISSWKMSRTGSSAMAAATEFTSDEQARPSATAAMPTSAATTMSSPSGHPSTTAPPGPCWFAVEIDM